MVAASLAIDFFDDGLWERDEVLDAPFCLVAAARLRSRILQLTGNDGNVNRDFETKGETAG